MLFAARRNEDGNVHRRDGVSKTVTKIMCDGFFFKNPKTKERPNQPAGEAGEAPFQPVGRHSRGSTITADTAERSFPDLILKGISGFFICFLSPIRSVDPETCFPNRSDEENIRLTS